MQSRGGKHAEGQPVLCGESRLAYFALGAQTSLSPRVYLGGKVNFLPSLRGQYPAEDLFCGTLAIIVGGIDCAAAAVQEVVQDALGCLFINLLAKGLSAQDQCRGSVELVRGCLDMAIDEIMNRLARLQC